LHVTNSLPVGPPPPFDAEIEPALAAIRPFITPWKDVASIPSDRQSLLPVISDEELSRGGAFTVEERLVAGSVGAPDLPLLICRPTSAAAATRPALYWMHPGGMIVGDARTGLDMILDLAAPLGLVVVSVGYRLAPENPHPAPVEDCYAGLQWTVEHAAGLDVDPERVIVAGGSAGGGLAAAVTILARERGGPALLAQMLLSPMLDDRNDTPSSLQMAGLDIWDHQMNAVGWKALLGDAVSGPNVPPDAAPARATDLAGLPPAFIDVGSAETFRDEAVQYAARLWQAGGRAELHVWSGGFHGFERSAPDAAISKDARAAKARWLSRMLAG
jgi:acetyl esterase/lipase